MRKIILAVSAAALTVPATFVIPTSTADAAQYRTWRGKDGRTYCRRPDGTTGLIVGGVAGALVGRALDGGRNHATGTILGAAGGALLGRHVERSNSRERCVARRR